MLNNVYSLFMLYKQNKTLTYVINERFLIKLFIDNKYKYDVKIIFYKSDEF